MSDDFNFDDDDLDFDDLDMLFDENEDAPDDRNPIEKLVQGALDSILTKDNAASAASVIAENALPREYSEAVSAGQTAMDEVVRLYDDAKEEIEKPLNSLKKLINRNIDRLPSFIDDEVKERIRSASVVEERPDSITKERDVDSEALNAALTSIFEQNKQQMQIDVSSIEQSANQAQANAEATLSTAGRTNQLLGRLVGYQDTIQYEAQRKDLELQHLQYYALRDILKVTRGAAEDQQTANAAIVKNTALPDFLKIRTMEGYRSVALTDLYGKVNETIGDFTSNFRERLMENARGKMRDFAGSFSEGIGIVEQAEDAAGMASDTGMDGYEAAGSVGASLAQDFILSRVGKMLRKKLEANPRIAAYAQDIEYALAAYPREISQLLKDWDGGVFPPQVLERFPWLEKVNLAFLADTLKEINVLADDQDLTFTGNLRKEGLTAVPFDNLTRRSIVEVIPGFLSRILEQVTLTNNPDAERVLYSIDREGFVGASQLAAETDTMLFKRVSQSRQRVLENTQDSINDKGSLSESTREKLGQVLLRYALENRPVRTDEIFQDDTFTQEEKDELTRFIQEGGQTKRQLRNILANAVDDLANGQAEMQKAVNELYSLGQLDALRETGILKDSEFKEQAFLSRELVGKLRKVGKDSKRGLTKESFTTENFTQDELDELGRFLNEETGNKGKTFKRDLINIDFEGTEKSIRQGFEHAIDNFNRGTGEINSEIDNAFVNRRALGQRVEVDSQTARTDGLRGRLNRNTETNTVVTQETIDYTNILERALSSISNLPSRLYDLLTKPIMDERAVPVFMVEGEGGLTSQGPPEPQGPTPQEPGIVFPDSMTVSGDQDTVAFRDTLLTGMSEMSQLMAQLVVNTANPQSVDAEVKTGPGFLSNAYSSTMGMLGKYISSAYGAIGRIGGGALSGGGSIIGGALSMFGGRSKEQPQDIFVEGSDTPVLEANKLARGEYVDAQTGETIRSLNDISGEVIDRAGNVVISAADSGKAFYTRSGERLTWLTGLLSAPFKVVGGYYDMLGKLTSGTLTMGANLLRGDKAKDVYVNGENLPRLRGFVMRNGGYISGTSQEPIYTVGAIDGPVYDREGNLLIGPEDLQAGLVDVKGNPIEGTRIGNFLRQAGSFAKAGFNLGMRGVTGTVDYITEAAGNTRDAILGMFDRRSEPREGSLDEQRGTGEFSQDDTSLGDILDYLKKRFPIESVGESIFDSDDDGDRDNSLTDIFSRRKEKKEEQAAEVETAEKGEGLWGKLFGILTMIAPAIAGLGGVIATWAERLLVALGIKKGVDVATGGGVDADLPGGGDDDKKGKGKKGRTPKGGKKGGLLRRAGRGLVRGAKAAAPLALMAGKQAGKFALRAGAGALAAATGLVSAPVAATAAAVAGVAYTGYQVFDYFASRADAEPLERLRFLQYGLNPDIDDHLVKIRDLEANVEDEITWSGNKPKFNLSVEQATNEWAEEFGINTSSEREMKLWATWFAKRFIPIYLTHAAALKGIDPNADLGDVDDDLGDTQKKLDFLNAITLKGKYRADKDPLSVIASPIPGYIPGTNEAAITALSDKMKTELGNKINSAPTFDEKPASPEMSRDGKSEARVIQAYESKRPQVPMSTRTADSYMRNRSTNTRASTAPKFIPVSEPTVKGKFLMVPIRDAYRISSPFGPRIHPITGKRKMHKGVDFAAVRGTPIYACADGKITRRAFSSSYGNVIYIEHHAGKRKIYQTRYAHMDRFEPGLQVGDEVKKGQLIGYVGNTGASAGHHLHLSLRMKIGGRWRAIDPMNYFGDSNIAKEVKDQERSVKEERDEVESVDETLEGQDTIQSTIEKRPVLKPDSRQSRSVIESARPTRPSGNPNAIRQVDVPTDESVVEPSSEVKELRRRLETIQDKAKKGEVDKSAVKALSQDLGRLQSRMHTEAQSSRQDIVAAINEQNKLMAKLITLLSDGSSPTQPSSQPSTNRQTNVRDLLGRDEISSSIDLSNY